MTIDELKIKLKKLTQELELTGEPQHNKSASKRARLLLGEIKNSVVGLRSQLVELDRK